MNIFRFASERASGDVPEQSPELAENVKVVIADDAPNNAAVRLEKKLIDERTGKPFRTFEQDIVLFFEREKSEEILRLIESAELVINEYLLELGITHPTVIPLDRIHILHDEAYKHFESTRVLQDGGLSCGLAYTINHEIFIRESLLQQQGGITTLLSTIIHELLHIKGYNAYVVGDTAERIRDGLTLTPTVDAVLARNASGEDRWQTQGRGLNEAVVSVLEKKMLQILIPVVNREGLLPAYPAQVTVLTYVCEMIAREFPDTFADTDSVLTLFAKAHFGSREETGGPVQGSLLPIGKYVDRTFGTGAFRLLLAMSDSVQNPVEIIKTKLALQAMYDERVTGEPTETSA